MNREYKLSSFKDVDQALLKYVPLVKELTGKDTVMDRIIPLMAFLGNPQDELKTIHIAGTSGKTSTSYYISNLLELSGKKIGLTVSPHIDTISERTQINNQPLSELEFCFELGLFLKLVDDSGVMPSYFELMYAFAIWLFAKYKVDYAVIETGVGGLFDATNIVTRPDKICVLTDIGFDHTHLLGNTIEAITKQKVGIVHPKNQLLMYIQDESVMSVVKSWTDNVGANLHSTSEQQQATTYGVGDEYNKLANYQQRNWLLAYFVYRFVAKRDDLIVLNKHQLIKSQLVKIPARMDVVKIGAKLIIYDGAHNYQKMDAFIASFKKKYKGIKPDILLAFKTGKDYTEALPLLQKIANRIIVTTFETNQDLPVKSSDPKIIASQLKKLGFTNVIIEPNMHLAYKKLIFSDNKLLVITGSFYLISQLRRRENKDD
jgi:dihydrofolate synthase/folylpolyglutamate synthase